jgi:hypothetical protein
LQEKNQQIRNFIEKERCRHDLGYTLGQCITGFEKLHAAKVAALW